MTIIAQFLSISGKFWVHIYENNETFSPMYLFDYLREGFFILIQSTETTSEIATNRQIKNQNGDDIPPHFNKMNFKLSFLLEHVRQFLVSTPSMVKMDQYNNKLLQGISNQWIISVNLERVPAILSKNRRQWHRSTKVHYMVCILLYSGYDCNNRVKVGEKRIKIW